MFKKYLRRARVWIGIQKTKPEKEIIDLLKRNTRVVEQEECRHKFLFNIFPEESGIFYRCTSCNQLWIVTQAMTVNADKLPELIRKLQAVAQMKPKNKKTMSLDEFKKRKK